MSKINNVTQGVFTNIVGTSSEISTYNQFINIGEDLNISKDLREVTKTYMKLVNDNKDKFEQLASLEEVMIQMRIRENLNDVKLLLVREYIYARTPFYRKSKKSKDLRVIVNKIEFYPEVGTDVSILASDERFMSIAKRKLGVAIDTEIKENIRLLKTLMNN
jgi:hypothetical protein